MIGIIFIGNIELCPYLKKYEKIIKYNRKKYEVLFWRRVNYVESYPDNYIYFNKESNINKKKVYKLNEFIQYRMWLLDKIKKRKYNKLIILDTLSGLLLSNELKNRYNKKYIFDIRDYSYEKIKLFFWCEKNIIRRSYFTSISSKGFKAFLPNYKYVIANNLSVNFNNINKYSFSKKSKLDVLNIVWIGSIRYYEHQVSIIDKLKNDSRFNIIYHGTGPDFERLKEYCISSKITNILFTGKYNEIDKENLLINTDLLLNNYDIKVGHEVIYAISNKYYDGIYFRIPQITELKTYKAKLVRKMQIGYVCDTSDKQFGNKIYNYYHSIDINNFNKRCEEAINKYINEDLEYMKKINEFIFS